MSVLDGYTDFTRQKYIPQPKIGHLTYGDVYESRAIDSIFPYYKGKLWLARAKPRIPVIAFENIFMAQYCITNFTFQRI